MNEVKTLRENLPTDSVDYELEVKTRVNNFLEGLIHKRFSNDSLNEKVSNFFGTDIEVSETSGSEQNDDELSDWNFMFGMDIQLDKYHLYGYVDIYFLKHKQTGFDGSDFMVTEVAIEFE